MNPRVLLTSDYYLPFIGGGVEVVVQQLAERLASRGYDVSVLTYKHRRAPRMETIRNVKISKLQVLPSSKYS